MSLWDYMSWSHPSNEAVNFSVSIEEKSFWSNPDMYNTVSNLEIDLLSIYPTDYSIANLHSFIQIFLIFASKKHPVCFLSWALPTPSLWNKDGGFWQYYKCRRDKEGDSGIPFRIRCLRLSFLQILCQSFSIEDCQLIQYLIPVPISLGPLLCHIQTGQAGGESNYII